MSQHWPRGRPAGFTLIELLVVITIIGILAAIALPNYIRAKDKAREVQSKSALHSLQVAVERYMTDFERYPQYLLGGDREGWRVWHQRYDEANPPQGAPANAHVKDILVEFAYLDSYPRNPFVDNGGAVLRQTGNPTGPGGAHQPGDGDPRFGFRGELMGNGCEVPILFRNWFNNASLNIETERTLLTVTNNNPAALGFLTPNTNGMHYTMGGHRSIINQAGQQRVGTVFTHWPGSFFYRGLGTHHVTRKGFTIYVPTTFVKSEVTRYMMGVYGSNTSEGMDVIRLMATNESGGAVYYRLPPPWSEGSNAIRLSYNVLSATVGGLPEMCGGGNATLGPWYPYDRSTAYPMSFIYGSPDGQPDAVILVLTAGEEVRTF